MEGSCPWGGELKCCACPSGSTPPTVPHTRYAMSVTNTERAGSRKRMGLRCIGMCGERSGDAVPGTLSGCAAAGTIYRPSHLRRLSSAAAYWYYLKKKRQQVAGKLPAVLRTPLLCPILTKVMPLPGGAGRCGG
eukprot:2212738-Rhodomonas_salina.2